jgi:hypothetical protein
LPTPRTMRRRRSTTRATWWTTFQTYVATRRPSPNPPVQTHKAKAGGKSQKVRGAVSAEAYGQWNQKKAFVPPKYEKTEDQKTRIKGVLAKSFMFAALEPNDLNIVIDAMREVKLE